MPSKEFMNDIKKMEILFRRFHKENVCLEPRPIERLAKIIVKRLNIQRDIALLYSKTRLFIRLKCLNKNLQVTEKQMRRRNLSHKIKMMWWLWYALCYTSPCIINKYFLPGVKYHSIMWEQYVVASLLVISDTYLYISVERWRVITGKVCVLNISTQLYTQMAWQL